MRGKKRRRGEGEKRHNDTTGEQGAPKQTREEKSAASQRDVAFQAKIKLKVAAHKK